MVLGQEELPLLDASRRRHYWIGYSRHGLLVMGEITFSTVNMSERNDPSDQSNARYPGRRSFWRILVTHDHCDCSWGRGAGFAGTLRNICEAAQALEVQGPQESRLTESAGRLN